MSCRVILSFGFFTNTAGTPAFSPPEALSQQPGEPPYSGKVADIWSLGVTLYSLVFGQVPFKDDNILALYNKIRTQQMQVPEEHDVSHELLDLLGKMLMKNPNERITLQDIKADDWVTGYGMYPMPTEEDNCHLVEVSEAEVQNSVRSIPKLDTLILVKKKSLISGCDQDLSFPLEQQQI
jgi:[calcium/calmodulin-dependent protein kinase] kinase